MRRVELVDGTVVSTAKTVVTAGGHRMFQIADSGVSAIDLPVPPAILVYRIIIPCDNSAGTTDMGVYLNGFFTFNHDARTAGHSVVNVDVETRWHDEAVLQNEQNIVNTGIFRGGWSETGFFGAATDSVIQQINFLGGGTVAIGEVRDLAVDLYASRTDTSNYLGTGVGVRLSEIGFYVQGVVAEDIVVPAVESYDVDHRIYTGLVVNSVPSPSQTVGSQNPLFPSSSLNYATRFPRLWQLP
jgi:hypothetical protein